MWNDVEAKIDLLNFSHVAKAAAQLIQDAGGEPLTIGVSGNWGDLPPKPVPINLLEVQGLQSYLMVS